MLILKEGLTTIADQISAGKQGWTREVTVKWQGHKIRAHVYRDSYAFQSRIRVEVWSPTTLSWNTVRTLEGKDYADLPGAYALDRHNGGSDTTGKTEIFGHTNELVDELIAYAQEVLS